MGKSGLVLLVVLIIGGFISVGCQSPPFYENNEASFGVKTDSPALFRSSEPTPLKLKMKNKFRVDRPFGLQPKAAPAMGPGLVE